MGYLPYWHSTSTMCIPEPVDFSQVELKSFRKGTGTKFSKQQTRMKSVPWNAVIYSFLIDFCNNTKDTQIQVCHSL